MKLILLLFLCAFGGYILIQGAMFFYRAQEGYALVRKTKPFERENKEGSPRILILGDSTAYGTGAESPERTTAGYFGRDFPGASIENLSANGAQIADVIRVLENLPDTGPYDLVVVQAGANDVIYGTSLSLLPDRISHMLALARARSAHVVWLTAGNIGLAPIFPWPIDRYLTKRTLVLRDMALAASSKEEVIYIDLFNPRGKDPFEKDVPRFYAKDRLHLSGEGYAFWYSRIREEMEKGGVKFAPPTHTDIFAER